MDIAGRTWLAVGIFAFVVVAVFISALEGAAPKWKFVGFTKYRDPLFVDLARTTVDKNGSYNVWTRVTLAEKSLLRRQLKQDLKRVHKSPRDVKYMEMNKDIVCHGNWIRHVGVIYYDYQGRILTSIWDAGVLWKPIDAGSLWPDLRKAVCTRGN
ncbi:MAG: hypothetical protein PHN75_08840 [Syntrophales bacterium]|nr:hypothetical protein [Syntrophales bacterium]